MREIRPSGLEGGTRFKPSSLPLSKSAGINPDWFPLSGKQVASLFISPIFNHTRVERRDAPPCRAALLARSGRSVPAGGGHPVLATIELLRHFSRSPRDFFYYSDSVRLTPIHPDAVRLEHEEIGRFGAIGAVLPRGRIELLRHPWRLRNPSAGPPAFPAAKCQRTRR